MTAKGESTASPPDIWPEMRCRSVQFHPCQNIPGVWGLAPNRLTGRREFKKQQTGVWLRTKRHVRLSCCVGCRGFLSTRRILA